MTQSNLLHALLGVRWWLGRSQLKVTMDLLVTVARRYKVVEVDRMLRSHAGYIPRVAAAETAQFSVLSLRQQQPVDELASLLPWFGDGNTGSTNSKFKASHDGKNDAKNEY